MTLDGGILILIMVNNLISAVILVLFFYGRSLHKKDVDRHIKWMYSVMALDLTLVAYLAIFRNALSKIDGGMSPLLMIHLSFAVSTVLLYFLMAYFGTGLAKGKEANRLIMRRLDKVMVFCRVFTLVTSLSLSFFK